MIEKGEEGRVGDEDGGMREERSGKQKDEERGGGWRKTEPKRENLGKKRKEKESSL